MPAARAAMIMVCLASCSVSPIGSIDSASAKSSAPSDSATTRGDDFAISRSRKNASAVSTSGTSLVCPRGRPFCASNVSSSSAITPICSGLSAFGHISAITPGPTDASMSRNA